jgi:hypothetical protein
MSEIRETLKLLRSLSARERTTRSHVFKKFRVFECGPLAAPGTNGRRPDKTMILKYD